MELRIMSFPPGHCFAPSNFVVGSGVRAYGERKTRNCLYAGPAETGKPTCQAALDRT